MAADAKAGEYFKAASKSFFASSNRTRKNTR